MGEVYEEERPILMEAANKLATTNIFIDDTPGASVMDIRTKARRLYTEHGLDMIMIDYMQLMSGSAGGGRNENRQQEISYISRSLKGLARELNVPVIALSQLSRAVEGRADKRPMLSVRDQLIPLPSQQMKAWAAPKDVEKGLIIRVKGQRAEPVDGGALMSGQPGGGDEMYLQVHVCNPFHCGASDHAVFYMIVAGGQGDPRSRNQLSS